MPVRLHGQGGLALTFQQVGLEVQARMQHDLAQALHTAYKTAFELAPVDTGFLRGSMTGTVFPGEARLWAPAPYAGFQEYGTIRHRAQSFMRPAMRAGIAYLVSRGYRPT